ncbi:MAG: S-formylglutathione hydrolase [Halofilum sp. (in: g-proteobacteria)]|nr:S-formylglutathione hydrolase [Halofilum sp. (in: g-proteobacteria)]
MTTTIEPVAQVKTFDGWQQTIEHPSEACACPMRFAIFLPPQAAHHAVPVLYWLSGLTCTEDNFMSKAGAQRYAAECGIALVAMDTSPRGLGLPGEDDSYDFGTGAGFYVDATLEPWSRHYRMYEYVTAELPAFVEQRFPVIAGTRAISGHSMGGHGALVAALRNPGAYRSVSAFAPIVAPTRVPWGEKAFAGYLGDDREAWKAYDACELIAAGGTRMPLLVDQGDADQFLTEQLRPELLRETAEAHDHPLTLRMQPGYDHSYYFVASFIGDHIYYHADKLRAA